MRERRCNIEWNIALFARILLIAPAALKKKTRTDEPEHRLVGNEKNVSRPTEISMMDLRLGPRI